LNTRWNSRQGQVADQWLAFDLAAPQVLDVIVIHQETRWTRISEYKIQCRVDGEWQELLAGQDMPDIAVHRIAPVETDGLRIWISKTTGDTPTIKEVQAYSEKEE
jgi:hypothetical protein